MSDKPSRKRRPPENQVEAPELRETLTPEVSAEGQDAEYQDDTQPPAPVLRHGQFGYQSDHWP